jgi:Lrp/AsnC family leucine-responsive transcriptional regulator
MHVKNDSASLSLDAIDRRLLALLQEDAGVSNERLAQLAHVSAATSLRRVRRLERIGVIARRVALLDLTRIAPVMHVVCEVTLDRQGLEHVERFEARAVSHSSVRQCYRVSPGPDFVLIAGVRDMDEWAEVVHALFTQDANVRNVKAYFAWKRAKFDTSYRVLDLGAGETQEDAGPRAARAGVPTTSA